MSNIILGIESSCDDTSAAVMKDGELVSLGVTGQKIHEKYGGVVPEFASRAHQQQIVPVVKVVLEQAGLSPKDVTAIAFTQGPGLLGSLLVGTNFAKSFALAAEIPLISVNHMEAHILAHMIEDPKPQFPFLCLTVSGGHTQIVVVHSPSSFEILGETIDDAAGEAFDKTGKMMGLPYPAGPVIDELAKKGEVKFIFPEPKVGEFQFSFSGLKTSIRTFLINGKKNNPSFVEENKEDICASVQYTIVKILLNKLEKAAIKYKIDQLAIAGGVSANSGLREGLKQLCIKNDWKPFIPKFAYCTDNAAMIAMSGYYKFISEDFVDQSVSPEPRMKMTE